MKILNTTLVYIENDNKYLMLHRIKKENDVNAGKWIGVGGKLEFGESPEEGMEREVREETGLEVTGYIYCGIVTFVSRNYKYEDETEYMHLFKVTAYEGELKECNEGELAWVDKDEMLNIPHWKGDELFLSFIKEGKRPFFSMKFSYDEGELKETLLDGIPCFITERLILRPFDIYDADDLYEYAKDPEIGLAAGWKPHKSVEESKNIIDGPLSAPGVYAIIDKKTNKTVGSIGLIAGSKKERGLGEDEYQGELGYWLGRDFWGRGYIPEASEALINFGRDELMLKRFWIGYFDGNEKSKRVAEKLGFSYSHTVKEMPVPLLNEVRTEHFMVLEVGE